MLSDSNIILRAPEPADVDAMFRWENDSLSWAYGRTRAPMSRHSLWEYVNGYSADVMREGQGRFIIVDAATAAALGCIDLYEVDVLNRRAGVGIYIECDDRGKGVASSALELLCDYCQRELGLHQLWAVMGAENQPSRALFRRCGFKECGRLRSWIRRGEHYGDALIAQRLMTE